MKKFTVLGISLLCFSLIHAQSKIVSNKEKIITIHINGGTIEGNLISSSSLQPLAIIIAGSGPTDRDGNSKLGVFAGSYRMLANELAAQNIASFRYDKRAVGKSLLTPPIFDESSLLFDDYINDALKIYDYLKDTLGFKNIYFMGHSEGSLIGMVAAQKRPARGYVSISGAGRPIDVVISEQIKSQPDFVRNKVDSFFNSLRQGQRIDSVPPYLFSLFRPGIQPYMISWLKHDPREEIKNLKIPILILQGSCDVQVKVEDAENLHAANTKSSIDIIPHMTHVLKDAGENCVDENLKTYKDSTLALNPQFVKDIVSFIRKN